MSILDTLLNDNADLVSTQTTSAQIISVLGSRKNEDYGLFIEDAKAQACGFYPGEKHLTSTLWKRHEHYFYKSTKPTTGWIAQSPRMVVVARSQVGLFSQDTNQFMGYKTDFNIKKPAGTYYKTKYVIVLVDEKNNPLCNGCLTITTKGVLGATFNSQFSSFKAQFGSCLGGKAWKDEFWRNIVFQPTFGWKMTENGYIVSAVTGYSFPTVPTTVTSADGKTKEKVILPVTKAETPEEQAALFPLIILKGSKGVGEQVEDSALAYKDGVSLVYTPKVEDEVVPQIPNPSASDLFQTDYPAIPPTSTPDTQEFLNSIQNLMSEEGAIDDMDAQSIPF
jgi:hypothetical protein